MSEYRIRVDRLDTKTRKSREWKQGADPGNGEIGWGYAPAIDYIQEVEQTVCDLTVPADDKLIERVVAAVYGAGGKE